MYMPTTCKPCNDSHVCSYLSGVDNLGQFEFAAFYGAWYTANLAAPLAQRVPPPFAASPALLATTYKQSLIAFFNLLTAPPPAGFGLTFGRIMSFNLANPATYLSATMPELQLPSALSLSSMHCGFTTPFQQTTASALACLPTWPPAPFQARPSRSRFPCKTFCATWRGPMATSSGLLARDPGASSSPKRPSSGLPTPAVCVHTRMRGVHRATALCCLTNTVVGNCPHCFLQGPTVCSHQSLRRWVARPGAPGAAGRKSPGDRGHHVLPRQDPQPAL